ncbi:hypothetical protein N865_16675 [Intrasporangium oryzae NRRL B-24470]|uniref:Uncharacterized protein n=1 Tax=Intrasporangium oryzae NRRL B-24470 TaxID=1386089 RepID=W9G2A2_9MICO|nr:hypothetical protein [Intrasporangium oryzae]EWT00246.1 hypothetical protein N865_16675 [Intrasporangium oryzae NRRL B-24470]
MTRVERGGIVASFLENSSRRSAGSTVVLDAPMLSLSERVTYGARDELPGGRAVPASVIWTAEQIARLRYGVDWGAVDYLDDTSRLHRAGPRHPRRRRPRRARAPLS